MQVYDYSILYGEGMTLGSGPFGTTYYTLTGFHGAHVFGGVLMLGVILYRGMAGQFSGEAPRCRRGRVAVLALRRRRLDPALLDPVPAVGESRPCPAGTPNAIVIAIACVLTGVAYGGAGAGVRLQASSGPA